MVYYDDDKKTLIEIGNMKERYDKLYERMRILVIIGGVTTFLLLLFVIGNIITMGVFSNLSSDKHKESLKSQENIRVGNTSGWEKVAEYFDQAVNKSIDPCDDFYAFACGQFQGTGKETPDMELYERAFDESIKAISTFKVDENTPRTLKQAKLIYDKCVNMTEGSVNITQLLPVIESFGGWPLIYQDLTNDSWNPYALMGKLQSLHINNIFSASIMPHMKDQSKGNVIYLDQASPLMTKEGYEQGASRWIRISINRIAHDAADGLGIKLDEDKLKNDINIMLLMDYRMAMADTGMAENFSLYHHEFNVTTAKERWPKIDWEQYLRSLASDNIDADKVIEKNFNIARPDFVDLLAELPITPGKGAVHAQNYLMFKFVMSAMEILPLYREEYAQLRKFRGQKPLQENEMSCAGLINNILTWAGSRLYIDYSFNKVPGKPRETLTLMTYMVLEGFMAMIKETPWMTDHSKLGAYEKIFDVQKNVAYPLWIMDDDELDARHPVDRLNVLPEDDPFTMFYKLVKFATWFRWHHFLEPVDRTDFGMPPFVVNAWYTPWFNSITFPAAYLHAPVFDVDFPMAFNFGSLGHTMGHELVHGFDNHGSQFDEIGQLITWIDNKTYQAYFNMSKCLVKQYDNFCYPKYDNICINGNFTLGENIADNGGLGGAYLGYKAYIEQFGEEPRIPGQWSDYTMEQIFFLSFGHGWCDDATYDPTYQIQRDPHSPAQYRVIGSLQNYPPFQKAFGCKIGSRMAPKHQCNGWYSPS